MHPTLHRLLQEARSDELEIRHRAVGQIGLFLEKNTIVSGTTGSYKGLLDDELCALILDLSAQQLVVTELCHLISSDKMTEGMLWALGKASRSVSMQPLLQLLQHQSHRFNEEATWQALIALDNVIIISGSVAELQQQHRLIDEHNIVHWLQNLEASPDPRVQKIALRLMNAIHNAQESMHIE